VVGYVDRIADALGVSTTTVADDLRSGRGDG
jgi:hypothetical protein